MKLEASQFGFSGESFRSMAVGIVCMTLLAPGYPMVWAQQVESQEMTTTEEQAPKTPNDQLDSLVAPIALYPDPLLAQTLAASTYPLEVIQLQQWMDRNKNLKDQALADAVEKQNWDPSVQAMAAFPDVVQRLAGNIQWTTNLGNAFLAQQEDVMDAVQRMREKAQSKGTLKTSQQQKVETQTVEGGKQVIVIQQANPKVVYVPSYNPTVVYGAPVYPYPPIYYPPPGYYAAGAAIAFGAGVALGATWGGGWGWGCGWGHGDVNVNVNNKYVNNWNKNNYNKANFNQANFNKANINSGKWQHNPAHRGNAPYPNRGTTDRFRGNAQQLPAAGNRVGGATGVGNSGAGRPGGGGVASGNIGTSRPGGGLGAGNIGAGRPGGAARPSTLPAGGAGGTRPGGGAGTGNIGAGRPGGGDRIGNRSLSSNRGGGAFGGDGVGGGSARAASNRGNRSMGGGGLGGGGRGGGGRRGR